jgi:hypothetical protein
MQTHLHQGLSRGMCHQHYKGYRHQIVGVWGERSFRTAGVPGSLWVPEPTAS